MHQCDQRLGGDLVCLAYAEHGIDPIPGGQFRGGPGGVQSAVNEAAVAIADPIKYSGPGAGDIEVVVHGGGELFEDLWGRLGGRVAGLIAEFGDALVNTVKSRACTSKAVQREVKGLAIMSTDH